MKQRILFTVLAVLLTAMWAYPRDLEIREHEIALSAAYVLNTDPFDSGSARQNDIRLGLRYGFPAYKNILKLDWDLSYNFAPLLGPEEEHGSYTWATTDSVPVLTRYTNSNIHRYSANLAFCPTFYFQRFFFGLGRNMEIEWEKYDRDLIDTPATNRTLSQHGVWSVAVHQAPLYIFGYRYNNLDVLLISEAYISKLGLSVRWRICPWNRKP